MFYNNTVKISEKKKTEQVKLVINLPKLPTLQISA